MKRSLSVLFAYLFFSASVIAVEIDVEQAMEDPVYEERFKNLAAELRCVKCQNQSLVDSPAGIADDLRMQVHEQLHSGKSDDEIVSYLVDRYGEFIRYRPEISGQNLLLWIGPLLLLVIGVATLYFNIKARKKKTVEEPELSSEDHKRAQALLNEVKENQ